MRTALLILIYLFFLQTSFSQTPDFTIDRMVGIKVDYPWGLTIDSHNNLYVCDWQFRKFNQEGELDWRYNLKGITIENYRASNLATDKDDNLYLVNYSNSKVLKFDKDGNLLLEFGSFGSEPDQFRYPEDIAVDDNGNMYVLDSGNDRVQKYSRTGALIHSFKIVSDNPLYVEPTGIALDRDNNIYVVDGYFNKTVQKYSQEGNLLIDFKMVNQDIYLFNPYKIVIDSKGQVFISDLNEGSIQIFNTAGIYQRRIWYNTEPGALDGTKIHMAIDAADNLYVSDSRHQGDSQILKFSNSGQVLQKWGDTYKPSGFSIDNIGNVLFLDYRGIVTKFNSEGQKILQFGPTLLNREWISSAKRIEQDIHGNIYVLDSNQNGFSKPCIWKFSASGRLLNKFTDFGNDLNTGQYFSGLAVDLAGNMYVSDYYGRAVLKIGASGQFLQKITSNDDELTRMRNPSDVAVDPLGFIYTTDFDGDRIQKFSPNGEFIKQFGRYSPNQIDIDTRADIDIDDAGNVYVTSKVIDRKLNVYSNDGKLLYQIDGEISWVDVNGKGNKLAVYDGRSEAYTLYKSNAYKEAESFVSGIVYSDENQNCLQDKNEVGLEGIVVMATPGPYFTVTNSNGLYTLPLEQADYTITQVIPDKLGRTIRAICPENTGSHTVSINETNKFIENINFANQVTLSPYLSVSVSSTRRRRCFESTTKVTYTNSGFSPVNNAKVYLQLPKEVELLSADKTYTRLPNGTYVFVVGAVAAGQTGTITIQDKVVCGDESIRGLTVCTKAWITPGNQSAAPTPTTTVTGVCNSEKGMVRFVIRNTGQADMETGKQFRLYLDGQLSTIENYKLASGDSLVLWVPTGGKTARLEADQPEGNGDNTQASATVEACRKGATGIVSTGFVNTMPSDDEEAEVAEECLPIIDSFDPNDKLVTPVGRTEEKYTPTGVALKYKIRFQNTGTDVAYRVVVVDTLSAHLDLSTLERGATSHTARFEVSGKGRPVLTWTFDNIMLPDSTTNEPGSHGYIQFSIKPKADLPEKSLVENFADIFFDYNSPVRTNITANRIYDMPPVISENLRLDPEQIVATPGIESFSPAAGKYGTEVILTGKKFTTTPSSNKVYFNGLVASVVSATETELKVLVPATSATGVIKVETPDGAASSTEKFIVYQPPVISSFSPVEGIVGAEVTLTGQHLNPELIQSIKLGNDECEILSNTDNAVVVRVPSQSATSKFEIITKGGEAISSAAYVVWHQPQIISLSKQTDIIGATISITGENFAPAAERNKVWFGPAQAQVVQATSTLLTIKVPQGAQSGAVVVETPGGRTSSAISFDVIPGPVFVSMVPAKGSVGTEVEITGSHFGTLGVQDEITFNGEKALVLEASGQKYKVRVPRGATTGKVQIKGVGGVALSTSEFVIEDLTPAKAIEVYPNPTNGKFIISLLHADFDVEQVQIFTVTGLHVQTVTILQPQPDKTEIDLEPARPGIYLLHIKTDRGIIIKKISLL